MTDPLNNCPRCGMSTGACTHTTEGQVTPDPICPQPAVAAIPAAPSLSAAAGGADPKPVADPNGVAHVKRALLVLTEGYDGGGFKYSSLADRISYATAALRNALVSLEPQA